MIGAWLFEHLIKNSRGFRRGASGVIAVCYGDKGVILTLLLSRPSFLLFLFRVMGGGTLGGILLSFSLGVRKDGSDRLLARGEVGGDIQELTCLCRGLAAQLVDKFPTSGADDKCLDDIRIGDIGELGALLGKAPDKLSQSLIGLLAAVSEVLGIPRAHVCALEVPHKDLDQVGPVMNPPRWKVLQPSPCRISQE
jgi:hypothetical protein